MTANKIETKNQNGHTAQPTIVRLAQKQKFIVADDIYLALVSDGFDADELYRITGAALRIAQRDGVVEKTDQYFLSRRNNSSVQIKWKSRLFPEKEETHAIA